MKTSSVIRILGRYIFAVLLSYSLASLFSTQSVVASLYDLDIPVTWAERWQMSLHDLAAMAGMFLPMVAAGFAIALPMAAWLGRRLPARRSLLYALAGAAGLIAIHLSLETAFDLIPVAGARTPLGLAAQAVAGAVGGYCFAALGRRPLL